jgi:hypothetical protein
MGYKCGRWKEVWCKPPFYPLKCTVVPNVLCKRNQCVAKMFPTWPIWSRDLAPSTLSTYPPPYLPGQWGLSLLAALNKDGPGQWSEHLQAAQPRTCGPGKCMFDIVLYFTSSNTVFWNAHQMIICTVLIVVIFLGWLTTTWNKQVLLRAFITFSWVGLAQQVYHNIIDLPHSHRAWVSTLLEQCCGIDFQYCTHIVISLDWVFLVLISQGEAQCPKRVTMSDR